VNDDTSLDPADWESFRRTLHAAADEMVDYLATVRERPAWRPVPDEVKAALRSPAPRTGEPLDATMVRFRELVLPYATGNLHPRFFGWVHGAGTPAGVLAEFLAAAMNANVGGREHAAVYVEREVIGWFAEVFGFPESSSGVLTTGTSMGNLLGVVAARDAALRPDAREAGIGGRRLAAYAAAGVHDSVAKALRIAGLGMGALRSIPVDDAHAMSVPALRSAVAADRVAGIRPFLVVATAGSVDSGAFDPLAELAELCAAEGIWLHVDGAFGALARLSPAHAHLVAGIERADSLAFDAHKWLHVPYATGCVLFRDARAHRAAFVSSPEYLARAERGTASGAPWFADYGLELSREFRALKVWVTLRHYGLDRLGASIARTCDLAVRLAELVRDASGLELLAPVALNVVCFRVLRPGTSEEALDRLNAAVAIAVQESGIAVPSTTRIGGKRALRACIINHRTVEADLDLFLDAVREAAARLT
jgi:aromatic-L-amino-acid decarboxylase